MDEENKRWGLGDIPDLSGKTAVVTGANSGIGLETAAALLGAGARVIFACRSEERARAAIEEIGEERAGDRAQVEPLDLADLESVRAFVGRFCEGNDRLHILVNNAGVMIPPLERTAQGFESQMGINHLGHFALTGLLLDLLLATPGARVVVVSSLMHRLEALDLEDMGWEARRYNRWKAYGASKLANLLFMRDLARRARAAGADLVATASHPGWTNTELQKHSGFATFFNPLLAQKRAMGALPSIRAATEPGVKGGEFFGPGGVFEIKGPPKRVNIRGRAHDNELARALWDLSAELTGVGFERFP